MIVNPESRYHIVSSKYNLTVNRAPVDQLVEHRVAMREVMRSTYTQALEITEEKVLPL